LPFSNQEVIISEFFDPKIKIKDTRIWTARGAKVVENFWAKADKIRERLREENSGSDDMPSDQESDQDEQRTRPQPLQGRAH